MGYLQVINLIEIDSCDFKVEIAIKIWFHFYSFAMTNRLQKTEDVGVRTIPYCVLLCLSHLLKHSAKALVVSFIFYSELDLEW